MPLIVGKLAAVALQFPVDAFDDHAIVAATVGVVIVCFALARRPVGQS